MKVAKKKWQEKEIAVLERMAERFPPEQIVKRLRHIGFYRSEDAVKKKIFRLQMSRALTLDNISAKEVGKLLGIHHSTIAKWVRRGLLIGDYRSRQHYMIRLENIKKFIQFPPKGIAKHVSRFNPDGVKYLLDDY